MIQELKVPDFSHRSDWELSKFKREIAYPIFFVKHNELFEGDLAVLSGFWVRVLTLIYLAKV